MKRGRPARRRRPAGLSAALLLGISAGLTACATPAPVGPNGSEAWVAFTTDPPSRLRALFRSTVYHAGGRQSFRQIVAIEPPDRIRFEILGPFGGPRLIVAIEAGSAVGLFPRDRVYFLESDSSRVMEILFGARVAAADLIPILAGTGFSGDGPPAGPTAGGDGWRWRVTRAAAGLRYDLLWDPRHRTIRAATLVQLDGKGTVLLEAAYPRRKPGRPIPPRIELSIPAPAVRIVIRLQHGEAGGDPFSPDLFRPPVPESFRRIDVEELAREQPWLAGGG